jgi:hypothetical protein
VEALDDPIVDVGSISRYRGCGGTQGQSVRDDHIGACALVKRSGMEFADAFAQIKSELGAQSREKKSAATLDLEEQLANRRSPMTHAERDSLLLSSVKGMIEAV